MSHIRCFWSHTARALPHATRLFYLKYSMRLGRPAAGTMPDHPLAVPDVQTSTAAPSCRTLAEAYTSPLRVNARMRNKLPSDPCALCKTSQVECHHRYYTHAPMGLGMNVCSHNDLWTADRCQGRDAPIRARPPPGV